MNLIDRQLAGNKNEKYQLLVHFIVFSFLTLVIGKIYLGIKTPNGLLFIYGSLISFVLLVTFFISFVLYKDPFEEKKKTVGFRRKQHLVSCIVAVKDEEEIVESCIRSIINQTYRNTEIIFVNDGSEDNTLEILQRYESLIKIINLKQNVGKKRAIAHALIVAKGDIFAFTDSDSVWEPDAIARIVDVLDLDPEIGAVSGHVRAMNADNNLLTRIQDSWYEGQFSVRKAFESYFGL